jgi:AbiV family abortive infection protein
LEQCGVGGNRKYSKALSFIEDGFKACSRNAIDLTGAAETLSAERYYAPCLSMSVLALEEMGKMFFIDGLLFAKSDGTKAEYFGKSLKSHNVKLAAVPMISSLATIVARSDPRFNNLEIFRRALAMGHENWKQAGQEVLDLAGQENFEFLDRWKQSGFYVSLINGNKFQSPRDGVDPNLAECVRKFAQLSAANLEFAFSDGNLKRYMEQARAIRSKLSERDHQILEENTEEMIGWLFGFED